MGMPSVSGAETVPRFQEHPVFVITDMPLCLHSDTVGARGLRSSALIRRTSRHEESHES